MAPGRPSGQAAPAPLLLSPAPPQARSPLCSASPRLQSALKGVRVSRVPPQACLRERVVWLGSKESGASEPSVIMGKKF